MSSDYLYSLLRKYFSQVGECDVMVTGYPGHFDVFLGGVNLVQARALVWDICLSITWFPGERADKKPLHSPVCWVKNQLRLPDRHYSKRNLHGLVQIFRIPEDRFRLAPLGADDAFVRPLARSLPHQSHNLVLFYGTFHPNSGVLYIVEAARLLQRYPNIRIELIGKGPDWEEVRRRVGEYGLRNLQLVDWMEKDQLVEEIPGLIAEFIGILNSQLLACTIKSMNPWRGKTVIPVIARSAWRCSTSAYIPG
jgi:glycosyltransferase involved in cell wall biosynthesis